MVTSQKKGRFLFFYFIYETVWLMNYQNLHIYHVVSLIQPTSGKSGLYVAHNVKLV